MPFTVNRFNRFGHAARRIIETETDPLPTVQMQSLVDLSAIESLRLDASRAGLPRFSYTAYVVKAVALALKDFPDANRRVHRPPWYFLAKPRVVQFHRCDISVAAERALPGTELISLVDTMRDADSASLPEINAWLERLSESDITRNPQWSLFYKLISHYPVFVASFLTRLAAWVPRLWVKYRGAAVLITSPGKYGPDLIASNWTSPIGISFGFVKHRPLVDAGKVVARPSFHLLVHFDRRTMHGSQGARFLNRIVRHLENPFPWAGG
jgi:pyruvate/2-oxoglutarate dehydrogenase complex dihydrolipoamide acyltransferase (E2) component